MTSDEPATCPGHKCATCGELFHLVFCSPGKPLLYGKTLYGACSLREAYFGPECTMCSKKAMATGLGF